MKIVFVSDSIYPYHKGGKEKRLYELSTRLVRLGHEVHIYTMHWWENTDTTVVEEGVQLHAISPLYPMYKGSIRSIKAGVLFGIACLKLITVPFDVLDVDHMPYFPVFSAWIVCLLRRKKLYGTWHEALSVSDWTSYMGKGGYIAYLIERLSIMLPAHITAASEHTKRLLGEYHKRRRNIAVVASGIDSATLSSIKPIRKPYDVLYVGRFVKDKNVDVLIHAMVKVVKTHPGVRCAIIGQGIEQDALTQLVADLGMQANITILPPQAESSTIYAYMKRAKVFVLPSVREGFGIVALEALSCGTPVITTNSTANAAKDLIVSGVNGSVVTLGTNTLAAAINEWLSKDKQPLDIARSVEQYDWQLLAARQSAIYEASVVRPARDVSRNPA
ncbi:MAG TPA: glycosyltransferase family 4 protein [Candidatus Saccharimonadales bacterium]|nr:glycosyltransferase family 4 protein [Candidatus Saccharimonadales bacterium]